MTHQFHQSSAVGRHPTHPSIHIWYILKMASSHQIWTVHKWFQCFVCCIICCAIAALTCALCYISWIIWYLLEPCKVMYFCVLKHILSSVAYVYCGLKGVAYFGLKCDMSVCGLTSVGYVHVFLEKHSTYCCPKCAACMHSFDGCVMCVHACMNVCNSVL